MPSLLLVALLAGGLGYSLSQQGSPSAEVLSTQGNKLAASTQSLVVDDPPAVNLQAIANGPVGLQSLGPSSPEIDRGTGKVFAERVRVAQFETASTESPAIEFAPGQNWPGESTTTAPTQAAPALRELASVEQLPPPLANPLPPPSLLPALR